MLYGSNLPGASLSGIAIAQAPWTVFMNGNFWVCVFFVISGFVAAWGSLSRANDSAFLPQKLPGLLLRRYLRLTLPAFCVSALVLLLLKLGLFTNVSFADRFDSSWAALWYREDIYSFRSLLMESILRLCFAGSDKFIVVLWTLRYLFYGYFLAVLPIGFCRGSSSSVLWICGLLTAIGMVAGLRPCYFACFPLGAALACLTRKGWMSPRPVPAALLILAGLLMGGFPTFFSPDNFYRFLDHAVLFTDAYAFWHVLGAGALLAGLCQAPRLQGLLSLRIPQWLGKNSFSLYLIHVPMIFTLSAGCALMLDRFGLDSYPLVTLLSLCVTLPFLFLFSSLFRRWVELPCARLSKRILSLNEDGTGI